MDSIKQCLLRTLCCVLCGICMAYRLPQDDSTGYFKPVDSVWRAGGVVEFECRSPVGYSSLNYPSIDFVLKHNNKVMKETKTDLRMTDDFTRIIFYIADVSKQHAGNYTCEIIPGGQGKNVTLVTHLFVVEAEQKTYFVRKGNRVTLDCLSNVDHGFKPAVDWFVDGMGVDRDAESGMYTSNSQLFITSAEIQNAFQDIWCNVTSRSASDVYGSVSAALENGSGTEFQKTLSVVDVSTCKDVPCQLEARVYGTAVNITWMMDGEPLASSVVVNGSVQTSTTVDINSTVLPVTLIITGGQNTWSRNISVLDDVVDDGEKREPSEGLAGWIIALIVLGVVGVIVGVALLIWWRIKRRNATTTNGHTDPAGGNATVMSVFKEHEGEGDQLLGSATQNGLKDHTGGSGEEAVTTTQNGQTDQTEGGATGNSNVKAEEMPNEKELDDDGWVNVKESDCSEK